MLHSFISASWLRSWMSRSDRSPAINECIQFIKKVKGWHYDDPIPHTTIKPLPSNLKDLLDQHEGHSIGRIKYNGKTYARSTAHVGNSLIRFYPSGDKRSFLVPGQIEYIIEQKEQTILFVRRHLELEISVCDPFRHYPHFQVELYSSNLHDELEIVELDWIFSHFARYKMHSERVAILCLSRA
jgi:hypothetical protein